MTDQTATDDVAPEADGESAPAEATARSGRLPGKKLVLFFAMPVLLLAMTGAGIYFSGLADPFLGGAGEEDLLAEPNQGPSVYYDLPEMLVNLNASGRKPSYLKISVSLEMASEEDFPHLEQVMPRVVDSFQVYLRELRVEDLQGSAGLQRLREELLLRVNNAARPAVVRDVLFREMLVQ